MNFMKKNYLLLEIKFKLFFFFSLKKNIFNKKGLILWLNYYN